MSCIFLNERHHAALCEIKEQLKPYACVFSEVRVFGSCVRSSAVATSDIDLLVITEQPLCNTVLRGEIREAITTAADKLGIDTDVVFYSVDDYLKDDSAFTKRLRAESKGLLKGVSS